MSAKVRHEALGSQLVYETVDGEMERIVMGDWIATFLMMTPEYDVRIEMLDGTVRVIAAGSDTVGELDSLNLLASYEVVYEYGTNGDLRTVCFKER